LWTLTLRVHPRQAHKSGIRVGDRCCEWRRYPRAGSLVRVRVCGRPGQVVVLWRAPVVQVQALAVVVGAWVH